MAEVVLENVVKRYGDVVAVNDVSLTINDGEFVSLVGPSGCGKTTTLNMIAGLLELTEGSIFIGGGGGGGGGGKGGGGRGRPPPRRDAVDHAALGAQAARTLRGPAAARRPRPRARPQPQGVPDGRAAVEPRREAARPHARRVEALPPGAQRDGHLRHARPDGSDDDVRPHRGDEQRRAAAGRLPRRALPPPGQPLRRRLHRQPGDEFLAGSADAPG